MKNLYITISSFIVGSFLCTTCANTSTMLTNDTGLDAIIVVPSLINQSKFNRFEIAHQETNYITLPKNTNSLIIGWKKNQTHVAAFEFYCAELQDNKAYVIKLGLNSKTLACALINTTTFAIIRGNLILFYTPASSRFGLPSIPEDTAVEFKTVSPIK